MWDLRREAILFFIARGLALTHRPFRALELGCAVLDATETPTLWVMSERRCEAATQQKLVDYVRAGGRLVLIGRLCLEDGDGRPCTLLRDALGLTAVQSDPPFTPSHIDAFGYTDIPVSFVETYRGTFERVIATRRDETVGCIQALGRGQILVFGAALEANTLEDLDLLHRMALEIGCPPAFVLSEWADVRLSQGERGSFLFVNNYQDDPIETRIAWQGQPLFGGNAIRLPARQGAILPLNWQVAEGVTLHYVTAEVRRVERRPAALTLWLAQENFVAELSLIGWDCPGAQSVPGSVPPRRLLQGRDGQIGLHKQ